MLMSAAKRIASLLPLSAQQELKRRHFARQIARGSFRTDEPEWELAAQWLQPGDWAIDIGANIGHYTKRFSDLVGSGGRVIAFEPVPATFELLAASAARFDNANVTLLNLAASDATGVVGMSVPSFGSGLDNYYQASISEGGRLAVLSCAVDALSLPHPVRLIKVDAEGHDGVALRGARALLARDKPIVVIESALGDVIELMAGLGYTSQRVPGSSNVVFLPSRSRQAPGAAEAVG
jgi:FkbM family methyltransferase